jgi:hypothetical protein
MQPDPTHVPLTYIYISPFTFCLSRHSRFTNYHLYLYQRHSMAMLVSSSCSRDTSTALSWTTKAAPRCSTQLYRTGSRLWRSWFDWTLSGSMSGTLVGTLHCMPRRCPRYHRTPKCCGSYSLVKPVRISRISKG